MYLYLLRYKNTRKVVYLYLLDRYEYKEGIVSVYTKI